MTAQEMFEKLNMEKKETVGRIEYYFKNDMDYPRGIYAYVGFDLLKREYHTNMVNCGEEIQKAINKQVEELGWNEPNI